MITQALRDFEHRLDLLPPWCRAPPVLVEHTGNLIQVAANGCELQDRMPERQVLGPGNWGCASQMGADEKRNIRGRGDPSGARALPEKSPILGR